MNTPNEQDYGQWVETYAAGMYRLAYRLCGRRELAQDLVQESFCEAWKSRGNLGDSAKAKAWLFQILRHRWMHYLRDQSRRIKLTSGAEEMAGKASGTNPAEKLAESDEMQRALDTIDEDMRLPLLLVVMEGYTCQEVGDMLGMPLGTVLSRIHRAKAALRSHFEKVGKSTADIREVETK
jgi:RNA polymerase sigma-70 factor (ECF subfamily)